ncbi:MAG: phage tail tape measure protein [Burkholderiaceae bacterium]|nr:phage tail tape measure protein [Burkholderiaceae bacterium]
MSEAKLVITAEDRASAVLSDVRGNVADLAARFTKVIAPIAGASLAAAQFFNTISRLDDLNDAADALGVAASELSAFRASAQAGGVSAEAFDAALTKLNVKITESGDASTGAAELFRRLGISTRDAQGNARDAGAVLGDVAERFKGFRDGPEKAALAVELFGRAGAKLIPVLNEGRDGLTKFGGASEQTIKDAVRLQSQIDELAAAWDLLKLKAGGAAAAIALDVLNIRGTLDSQLQTTEQQINDTVAALESARPGSRVERNLTKSLDVAIAKAEQLRKQIAALETKDARPAPPKVPERSTRDLLPKAGEISDSARALGAFVEQLERQRASLEQISRVEQVLQFLRANPGVDTAQVRELLFSQARLNDEREREVEIGRAVLEINRQELAAQKALDDQLADFTGRTEVARKQALAARLEARLAAGEIFNADELDRAVKGIAGIREEVERVKDSAEQFGLVFASSIGQFIESGGAGGVRGFFDSVSQDLLKLVTQLLVVKPLAEAVKNALSGGAGGGGGWIQAAGSFFGGLFGGARADGGPVSAGRAYLVGERGPEMFVPRGAGQIVPNGGMAGAMTVTNNFTISGPVSRETETQIAAAAARAIAAASRRRN